MIKLLTKVNIIDNSGGIIGRCIKILKPKNVKEAKLGDIILITIIKSLKTSNIKKGDVLKGIVVRTKTEYKDFKWSDNAIILISSKDFAPIGTRIKGAISSKLKKKKGNLKYVSLAKITI